jgi:acetyl/propionyl-CoA carboxylase alpha subunit
MKYNLTHQEETTALTVSTAEEGAWEMESPEKRLAVTCRRIDDTHLFLTIDGVGCNAFVSDDGDAKQIMIDGALYQMIDADAQARSTVSGAASPTLPRDVTPPMPAVVVKIMVAAGQQVKAGDGLVVVSAMKMETTLTAPFDARVARINVAVDDKVAPGDILVDLEAGEEENAPEA